MKARDKGHRKGKDRGHRGNGKPPRWLVLGALASTALSARPALSAEARETGNALSYFGAGPAPALPARAFDLPGGPLGEALERFAQATGLHVEVADEEIRDLGTSA